MMHSILRRLMLGALLVAAGSVLALVLCPTAAYAQVAVSPSAVEASLPAGQQAEVAVTVTNEAGSAVKLFAVPLPEGGAPDDVGALLFHTAPATVGQAFGMAMTPDGRLFAANYGGDESREYTADLVLVRWFEHPQTKFTSDATGLAWMPPEHAPPGHPEGTLWWLDLDTDCFQGVCTVVSTLAIEGDLDGNETGRTVALPTGPGTSEIPSFDRGLPLGLSYDPEALGPSGAPGLFYYTDAHNEDFYAVDVEGTVAEGFPAPLSDYDPGEQRSLAFNSTLDATRGVGYDTDGPDAGAYFEVGFVIPEDTRFERVVVTDRAGRSTGVETPLGGLADPNGKGELLQVNGMLRSLLDPSVMYLNVAADPGPARWIYAIRAAPLPPRWLRASAAAPASLRLVAGETDTLAVRLDTEGLAVGTYAGLVELRAGGPNGEDVAAVPVALTVTESTATEEETTAPTALPLTVYPNPLAGVATVTLTLTEAGDVRVAVVDVLGREVRVLHDGPIAVGEHAFAFDGRGFPAGVYVVRATGGGLAATQRLTLVR